MRFFTFVDLQYMVLAFFLGILASVLVYTAWRGYAHRRDPLQEGRMDLEAEMKLLQAHDSENRPFVPFLVFVYAGIAVAAVAYAFVIGVMGGSF